MVTKITVQLPQSITVETPTPGLYAGNLSFGYAPKHFQDLGKRIETIGKLISYLNQYPEHDVSRAIGIFFAPETASVKEYTKKKRTYRIANLIITEEDTDSKFISSKPSYDEFVKEVLPRTSEGYYGKGDTRQQYAEMQKKHPNMLIVRNYEGTVMKITEQ